ncbi:hypothetical protein ABZP36_019388 [Zizania latifolia]
MAEIDTSPLESVQAALILFEQRIDQSRFRPDRKVQEIDILVKELASCKVQLEVKENDKQQANLKLEAHQKAMQELSVESDRARLESHSRIAQLETDNRLITRQQSEAAEECKALRDELTVARDELDAVKGSNSFVPREIELMETRTILERENTKAALTCTLQLCNSDKNLEVIKRQLEMIERLEIELLAKTVETDFLLSELKQVKEHCIPSVCEGDSEFSDFCFASEISMEACCKDIAIAMPESVAGNQEPQAAAATTEAPDTAILREDDGEFYMKEIGQAAELDDYVLVAKNNADADVVELKVKLDSARKQISDLRFILEEAVRRAELAEEAKAALEKELREEIQKKQRPPRLLKTPATPLTGSRGAETPVLPVGCLTLGKARTITYN